MEKMETKDFGGDVSRPYYKGGKIRTATMQQTATAWDEMMVAKYYPG